MIQGHENSFACPQGGLDYSFFGAIAREFSQQTFAVFAGRNAAELDSACEGLIEFLTVSLAADNSFETVWDPATGGIYASLLGQTNDCRRRAAALALRFHECGAAGAWAASLGAPAQLRFDRWLLPFADRVRVDASAERMAIELSTAGGAREIVFHLADSSWNADSPHVRSLPRTGTDRHGGDHWTIWPVELLDSWEYQGVRAGSDRQSPHALVAGGKEAMSVLEQVGGAYLPWVTYTVRHLVPWVAEEGQYPSGSSSTKCAPGLVGIGNHSHRLALADTLVHEASHQYYYLSSMLGPVDDGSDGEMYYNPFLEMKRPIDRVLLAYHAFANVLLFCREARARGVEEDNYLVKREEYLTKQLPVLEDALRKTPALTELGMCIWRPLYERVHN